jgi:hypothetical protein
VIGAVAIAGVAALLVADVLPGLISRHTHDILGAISLAAIGVAWLLFNGQRVWSWEFGRALLLSVAFFFWALNQVWPDAGQAVLWNDFAIALFVIDVLLVMRARC